MKHQYPNVYPLSVHLENEQSIYFEDNSNIQETLENSKKTKLTEWFEMNKRAQ